MHYLAPTLLYLPIYLSICIYIDTFIHPDIDINLDIDKDTGHSGLGCNVYLDIQSTHLVFK